jgi:hypothetical protein
MPRGQRWAADMQGSLCRIDQFNQLGAGRGGGVSAMPPLRAWRVERRAPYAERGTWNEFVALNTKDAALSTMRVEALPSTSCVAI